MAASFDFSTAEARGVESDSPVWFANPVRFASTMGSDSPGFNERNNLYNWRAKLDLAVESAHAQARQICQLGEDMTTAFHRRHESLHKPTKKIDHYSLEFKSCRPEIWAYRVRELIQRSYSTRQATTQVCARLQRLTRESTNEMWQDASLTTNALVSNIQKCHRDKASLTSTLAEDVREIGELERSTKLLKNYIHVKEAGLKKFLTYTDDDDPGSDVFLTGMKEHLENSHDDLKMLKQNFADAKDKLTEMHRQQADIARQLIIIDSDIKLDSTECLPLRNELNLQTRGGIVVNLPLRHSSN